ncbi:MAG: hypothetical protein V7707_19255 [Motiliproteus sp.]
MTTRSDQREQRLTMYWYIALIAMPLLVVLLLLNADPYERVQLAQVVELRSQLAAKGAGSDVIAMLDSKGGHNLTEVEWAALQQVGAEQFYFMLTSSTHSSVLKESLAAALADKYVTQAEYETYQAAASAELMQAAVLSQFGY